MSMAAEPCPQFVELEMRQVKVLEDAVVECRTVFTRTGQPTRDRGMAVAKDPYCRCDIDPFRKRGQHLRNALGCGFEAVQRRVSARAEGRVAGLTAQRLDWLRRPVNAIADQGMDVRIGDPIVHAGVIRTGEAVRVDALGPTASAFPLAPRDDRGTWGTCFHGACRLLPADWAIVWGARLQEPLDAGRNTGMRRHGWLTRPGQPEQCDHEQENEPICIGQHARPQRGVQGEWKCSSRIWRKGGAVKQSGARHRIIHDEERRHRGNQRG